MEFILEADLVKIPGIRDEVKVYRHSMSYHEKAIRPLMDELLSMLMDVNEVEDDEAAKEIDDKVKNVISKLALIFLHDEDYVFSEDDLKSLADQIGYSLINEIYKKGIEINSILKKSDAKKD